MWAARNGERSARDQGRDYDRTIRKQLNRLFASVAGIRVIIRECAQKDVHWTTVISRETSRFRACYRYRACTLLTNKACCARSAAPGQVAD